MKRSFLISLQRRRSQRRCTGATEGTSARQFWRATFSCPFWRPSAGGYQVSRASTRRELPPPRRHHSARVSAEGRRRDLTAGPARKRVPEVVVLLPGVGTRPAHLPIREETPVPRMIVRVILRTRRYPRSTLRVSLLRILDRR